MQLLKSIPFQKRRGYALIVTLAFLSVALIAYASMMGWVGSNAKITKRNNLFNQSQAAVESATEIIIGTMLRDFLNQGLNPASSYTGYLPTQSGWPTTFRFSDTNGTANASSVLIGPATTNWSGSLPAQFSGLSGAGQYCDAYARATPLNVGENLTVMNHQQVWFGLIPIFQFAVFDNMDLEINPGQNMTINGRVHSNQNIFAAGVNNNGNWSYVTFSNIVDAAQAFYAQSSPQDPYNNTNTATGHDIFAITNNNPLSHAQVLSLPIGASNDQATALSLLGIPPANATNANAYPYNEADIYVNCDQWGNLSVYYQNTNNASVQTLVPMDVTNIVGTTTNTDYSFVTNVFFYDYREGGYVNAIQLDVGQFGNWLKSNSVAINYQQQNTQGSTSKGHGINSVYVSNPYTIPSWFNGGSKLPGVRLVNGSQLPPAGLTVATAQPIYVQGNYNVTTNKGATLSLAAGDTTNTYPAALMGDAITILSANWSDTNDASTAPYYPPTARMATNTTINAACLGGLAPSSATNNTCGGGLQNFLRLQEDWQGYNLTYNGSIVVLFAPQYAITPWSHGSTVVSSYALPTRYLTFDHNFLNPSKLPPMTPQLRAFARTLWSSTQ